MDFRMLYEPKRQLLSIGYRCAEGGRPGALDPSCYDLLASEARLASFLAIAKGDLPEAHWFHLGRSVTSARVQATEMLLQERAPRHAAVARRRSDDEARSPAPAPAPAVALRWCVADQTAPLRASRR